MLSTSNTRFQGRRVTLLSIATVPGAMLSAKRRKPTAVVMYKWSSLQIRMAIGSVDRQVTFHVFHINYRKASPPSLDEEARIASEVEPSETETPPVARNVNVYCMYTLRSVRLKCSEVSSNILLREIRHTRVSTKS